MSLGNGIVPLFVVRNHNIFLIFASLFISIHYGFLQSKCYTIAIYCYRVFQLGLPFFRFSYCLAYSTQIIISVNTNNSANIRPRI